MRGQDIWKVRKYLGRSQGGSGGGARYLGRGQGRSEISWKEGEISWKGPGEGEISWKAPGQRGKPPGGNG